ncbi:MAG: GGDEF domain-containing protein, partial [Sulfuricurvum sp.]|nr:GGDEF domain-containing protein [Sulfuricurvum sp.]
QEIQLRIAIGVAELNAAVNVEQTLLCALNAMESADNDPLAHYNICNP